jgi:putative oxidoreductase
LYAWWAASPLRRLFSTFARGWPGVGLLLLRLIAAAALINQGASRVHAGAQGRTILLAVLMHATALLLLAGLWTPIAGVLAPAVELWAAFSAPGDHWVQILLGTLGAGLALLGPGVWSVDARLFGWKRIGSRLRKS